MVSSGTGISLLYLICQKEIEKIQANQIIYNLGHLCLKSKIIYCISDKCIEFCEFIFEKLCFERMPYYVNFKPDYLTKW